MKVIIVGSGVIGITTADFLRRQGYEIAAKSAEHVEDIRHPRDKSVSMCSLINCAHTSKRPPSLLREAPQIQIRRH